MATVAFVVDRGRSRSGSALGLVLKRTPSTARCSSSSTSACVAVLYLMLGAEFLAAAQVIVYAGAIMVLFVFAIMVLIPGKEETGPGSAAAVARWLALPVGRARSLLGARRRPWRGAGGGPTRRRGRRGSVEASAGSLFTDYLFPFELTSVLLLAAMVGVLLLARGRRPASDAWCPRAWYVALSAVLFSIGVVGVVIRRNPLVIFMSIELMLNAANLALVAFGHRGAASTARPSCSS